MYYLLSLYICVWSVLFVFYAAVTFNFPSGLNKELSYLILYGILYCQFILGHRIKLSFFHTHPDVVISHIVGRLNSWTAHWFPLWLGYKLFSLYSSSRSSADTDLSLCFLWRHPTLIHISTQITPLSTAALSTSNRTGTLDQLSDSHQLITSHSSPTSLFGAALFLREMLFYSLLFTHQSTHAFLCLSSSGHTKLSVHFQVLFYEKTSVK